MDTTEFEQLDDYVSGVMKGRDADAFEEALFVQAMTGESDLVRAATWLDGVYGHARQIEELGLIHPIVKRREFDKLCKAPVAKVILEPSTLGQVIPEEAVLALSKFPCEGLSGVRRVDMISQLVGQPEFKRVFADVPFDRQADAIYNCCHAATARMWPTGVAMTLTIVGYSGDEERVLAEYGPFEAGVGEAAELHR